MKKIKEEKTKRTGASAGIGASCARLFVESGSKVILTARRLAKLENLKSSLLLSHPNSSFVLLV